MPDCNKFHSDVTGNDVHVIVFRKYANAQTRLQDTSITAADVDKAVKDEDTGCIWAISNHNPLEFQELTNKSVVDLDVAVSVSPNDQTAGYLAEKLIRTGRIQLTEQNDGNIETLQISTTAEKNDGLNLGSADPSVFVDKSGENLRFRRLKSLQPTKLLIDVDNTGDYVTFDINVPIPEEIINVADFASLPESPNVGAKVFYVPFQEVLYYDGSDWVGKKEEKTLFGRNGNGSSSLWLRSVGYAEISPSGGINNAVYVPKVGGGSAWKLYQITAKNDESFTGTVEIHADATNVIPDNSTSKGVAVFNNQQLRDEVLQTPSIINANSQLQCFMRRQLGSFNDPLVTIVVARTPRAN